MNYLSHHLVARRLDADASPWFYVGNLLPDLLPSSGDARVRGKDVASVPERNVDFAALVRGARLHIATDKSFHGNKAFASACAEASAQLKAMPFDQPLNRTFFLAHALVEIALDGWIIQDIPGTAEDLYRQLSLVGIMPLVKETEAIVNVPLPNFESYLGHFLNSRFLLTYATSDGCATALRRVCDRANIPNFDNDADQARLGEVFANMRHYIARVAPDLLVAPVVE